MYCAEASFCVACHGSPLSLKSLQAQEMLLHPFCMCCGSITYHLFEGREHTISVSSCLQVQETVCLLLMVVSSAQVSCRLSPPVQNLRLAQIAAAVGEVRIHSVASQAPPPSRPPSRTCITSRCVYVIASIPKLYNFCVMISLYFACCNTAPSKIEIVWQ